MQRIRLLFIVVFGLVSGCVELLSAHPRQLYVKNIVSANKVNADHVIALMDSAGIEFDSISVVNWAKFNNYSRVRFRMAHTGREILLHYHVEENNVRAVVGRDYGRVWDDSCVELFLSPHGDGNYYNIEANCIGKLVLCYNRESGHRIESDSKACCRIDRWSSLGNLPFGLKAGHSSWNLTLVIPVEALFRHSLDSFHGRAMRCNLYKCGDKQPVRHYLTWAPIPTLRPGFHRPEYFGLLLFE